MRILNVVGRISIWIVALSTLAWLLAGIYNATVGGDVLGCFPDKFLTWTCRDGPLWSLRWTALNLAPAFLLGPPVLYLRLLGTTVDEWPFAVMIFATTMLLLAGIHLVALTVRKFKALQRSR